MYLVSIVVVSKIFGHLKNVFVPHQILTVIINNSYTIDKLYELTN